MTFLEGAQNLAGRVRLARRVLAVAGALTIVLAVSTFAAESGISVTMHRCLIPDSIGFPTPRKLTFGNPAAAHVGYPKEWTAVDAVAIFDNSRYQSAWLFRYRLEKNQDQYALAQPGAGAITDKDRLALSGGPGRQVITFEIPVIERSGPGRVRRHLSYQLISDSGAVAIRIADSREGEITIDSISYPIRLVQYNATTPFFERETNAAVFIEQPNGHGFATHSYLEADSSVIPSTRIILASPFRLGKGTYVIGAIDPMGDSIAIVPYHGSDTSMVRGFISPDWQVSDLDGVSHSLASAHGKVSLLLFWSTTCSYCARIRPTFNKLAEDFNSAPFQSIACCLDRSPSEIQSFLLKEPYEGIVVPFDSTIWHIFNRRMSTPAICVIDSTGVIQFVGGGESSYFVADRMVRDLLRRK